MEKRTGKHGRRKVNVPNLSGLTRSQAQSEITSRGLFYSESTTNTSDSNNTDKISSQGVVAGDSVLFGETIPFVYYNYVNPITYTYGPCEAYSSSTSYTCIGGNQNQETTTTYRRRQVLANGVWNGTYDECSASVSTGSAQYTDGRCGYVAPSITYGPCEAYGSGTNIGSGSQCSGTYYQTYTDYRYNTRKKIYSNGVWDGSSYTTSGCGTTDVRNIDSSSQVNGLCGYVAPPTITYGACEAYGSYYGTGSSGTQCSGTYYQVWEDRYYNGRRMVYSDGSWNGTYDYNCGAVTIREVVSSAQYDGYCGYTAPPPAVTYYCTESFNGAGVGNCTYTTSSTNTSYTNTSYSSRSCSTSGYPACLSTNPAPVCTSYLYQCKSYDVTNPASTNYYDCYSVGACTAPRNPDGSRTQCCASYA